MPASIISRDQSLAEDEIKIILKAAIRIFDFWELSRDEEGAIADIAPRTIARMRQGVWSGALTHDQKLRLSALVGLYKGLHLYFADDLADQWVKRPNEGVLFRGKTPLEQMVQDGLPAILKTRNYVDAIRGGV